MQHLSGIYLGGARDAGGRACTPTPSIQTGWQDTDCYIMEHNSKVRVDPGLGQQIPVLRQVQCSDPRPSQETHPGSLRG